MTLTYGHALLRVRLPALELQNLIMSMFLMVMAYLREDWGCTMERNTWVQPQFRVLQEIQSAKYKFYRITVLIFLCCTPSYAMYIGETARDMGIDTKQLPVRAGFWR